MKRLLLLVTGFLFLIVFAASGCVKDAVNPSPGVEVASSCQACHTDKDTLKDLAVEEEEEESEATTGEG